MPTHNHFAWEIAEKIRSGKLSATSVVHSTLNAIAQHNPKLNAFTHVLNERALKKAEVLDQKIAQGKPLGKLAGIPFSVKNLLDIQGLSTLAGSKINAALPPATKDALVIQRLEKEDAILVGALNMGEYAYDFTGENCHHGNCSNPWDTERMSGGSSSGSGSATAAGLAPISIGSDTNGSIRVPASLCGIFGLKPTYGRIPRQGCFPFSDSLDHLGPLARCTKDLALAFDSLQGYSADDHACANYPTTETLTELEKGIEGLRIRYATGYFDCSAFPQAQHALHKVCNALKVQEGIDLPGTQEARAAAYIITNVEGSQLHEKNLRSQAENFDPDTRDRFLAGLTLPAAWYIRAQQVRRWYAQNMQALFAETDIIIAPATPVCAPHIGQKHLTINGEQQLLRPNLGYFTQPFSAIGLPTVVIPTMNDNSGLPIGIQIVAAPWREDLCLRVAYALETLGFTALQPKSIFSGVYTRSI